MKHIKPLPRSTPEKQGVYSSGINSFLEAVKKNNLELHSFMLLRHGYVVSEGWWTPYSAEKPHSLFSLSKSFTSTAIGLAVEEGLLTVDDFVVSYFPEDTPKEVSENLAKLRIKHLLSMSTGHDVDTTGHVVTKENGNWVQGFLELPIEHEPGTFFVYNSGATYMLSAIIQKVTGQTLVEYLTPRLFKPLGMESASWENCPRGINAGGFGLSIRTEDIAKLGQLYLQKGVWGGKQILSEKWIEEATSKHISSGKDENSDWSQGYCYQFWRCRHDIYRGDGAFGQYCIVMPMKDAVIAITSSVHDMQVVLNLVWEHLLPAMKDAALPSDEASEVNLSEKLSTLELQPLKMGEFSHIASKVSEKCYTLESNDDNIKTISFSFEETSCNFKMSTPQGEYLICCGINRWVEGNITLSNRSELAASSCTWYSENTLIINIRLIETPFYQVLTCIFEGDSLRINRRTNISMGPSELPSLYGKITSDGV